MGHAPRFLFYSHDTVGMGNIRRTLLLARELAAAYADSSTLIVTGSPIVQWLRLPDRVDYLKLPSLDRIRPECYRARALRSHTPEVKRVRREILPLVLRGFDPDLVVVDKRPGGVGGELVSALEALRRRGRARIVLGLRDVLDAPERTRRLLRRTRSFEAIERFYDEVWIYGSASVFDATKEYAFPDSVVRRTRFCGYLRYPAAAVSGRIGRPGVLVTVGGGEDGEALVRTYLEGMARIGAPRSLRTEIVLGPQMREESRARLRARCLDSANVSLRDFAPDMAPYYGRADAVVSMAGYNTVCELLSHRRRAVLVPRARPVCEQLIRARRLAELGLFGIVEPSELSAETLMRKLSAELETRRAAPDPIDLGGLARVRERTRVLLGGCSP